MNDDGRTGVAVACQGGGSHTAFTAGVLTGLLRDLPEEYEITALSGTSGGAMCAALAWDGLRRGDVEGAVNRLGGFWDSMLMEGRRWCQTMAAGLKPRPYPRAWNRQHTSTSSPAWR